MKNEGLQNTSFIVLIDASWLKLVGLIIQEGITPRSMEALRDMEDLRLQVGLPKLEEIAGRPVRLH